MNPDISNTFMEQMCSEVFRSEEPVTWEALTGGVSSEIYKVTTETKTVVIKRALPQLKVQAHWEADISRNSFEVKYLQFVSTLAPDSFPRVLQVGEGYFVMEYLGEEFTNWKTALLDGLFNPEIASNLGSVLGRIHAHSFNDFELQRQFQSQKNFKQLRISPYIENTAERHPELKPTMRDIARKLAGVSECLVHGDLSPKNILYKGDRVVLLDCEVATFGDPAFDLAFLLTHLCLKALYHTPKIVDSRDLINAFLTPYRSARSLSDETWSILLRRTTRLLSVLILARVDGKSPVDYLDENKSARLRRILIPAIKRAECDLNRFLDDWFSSIQKTTKNDD